MLVAPYWPSQSWFPRLQHNVQISAEVSASCTYADDLGDIALRRFLSYLGHTHLGFLHRCFVKKYGHHVTRYLVHDLRKSSIRQYETARTASLRYVRLEKLSSFEEKTILGFFMWLFEKCNLQANTNASYRSALVKPLSVEFGLLIGSDIAELAKSIFHTRPPPSLVEPHCCHNKALDFLKTRRFTVLPTLADFTIKTFSAGSGFRQTCFRASFFSEKKGFHSVWGSL